MAFKLLSLPEADPTQPQGVRYRCNLHLTHAGDVFRAASARLPDVAGAGTSEREAIDAVAILLADRFRQRSALGQSAPALPDESPLPPGAVRRVVFVGPF